MTLFFLAILPFVTGVTANGDDSVPQSSKHRVSELATVAIHHVEPIVPSQLIAEDAARAMNSPGPLRFASPESVRLSTTEHGSWEPLPDGGQIWRLRINAPNATDLNLGFTRFRLPEGATLRIMSEDHDVVRGPYTALDNRDHGELWTPVIPGERGVVELYVPANPEFEPEIEIGSVGRGYRDLFRTSRPVAKQGSCNIDVACEVADEWRNEIQSVAVYSIDGYMSCTGVLTMDVPRSYRPFFLTAAHCGVTAANAHTVVTYWNFNSTSCGQLDGGQLNQSVTGATLLARRDDVDFSLLELDSTPPAEFRPSWSGWDRHPLNIPEGGVCIHHPNGDEKAISINVDQLAITSSCIATTEPDTHLDVDNWELGTTEPGSSGGGLWDPRTHLLVGLLSGGTASCSNLAGHDCFGRIAAAWDGPSAGERLRDWLDPDDTGVMSVFAGKRLDRRQGRIKNPNRTKPTPRPMRSFPRH